MIPKTKTHSSPPSAPFVHVVCVASSYTCLQTAGATVVQLFYMFMPQIITAAVAAAAAATFLHRLCWFAKGALSKGPGLEKKESALSK